MPSLDKHGSFYFGHSDNHDDWGVADTPTASVDVDSRTAPADKNNKTQDRHGPPYQFRIRQPYTPDSNDYGFVGSICWDNEYLYIKVQKDGDVGKNVKAHHKGQWKKLGPLLPHIPDPGSEAE